MFTNLFKEDLYENRIRDMITNKGKRIMVDLTAMKDHVHFSVL